MKEQGEDGGARRRWRSKTKMKEQYEDQDEDTGARAISRSKTKEQDEY